VSRISTITGLTRKDVTRVQATETGNPTVDTSVTTGQPGVIGGWVRR